MRVHHAAVWALLIAGPAVQAAAGQERDPAPGVPGLAEALGMPLRLGLEPAASPVRPAPIPLPSHGPWVGVTKWATLAVAAGLGTHAILLQEDADNRYRVLERRCREDPDVCRPRTASGAYADQELEDLYQTVLSKDRTVRLSFIASQVAFGVSVGLFILDFQKGDEPEDVPYDPETGNAMLRLAPVPGGLAMKLYLR